MRTLMKATLDETLEAASRREGTAKAATLTEPAAAGLRLYSGFNNEEKRVSGINRFLLVRSLFKNIQSRGRPDATFLLCDCVCVPQVCLMSGPGPGSGTEDE